MLHVVTKCSAGRVPLVQTGVMFSELCLARLHGSAKGAAEKSEKMKMQKAEA